MDTEKIIVVEQLPIITEQLKIVSDNIDIKIKEVLELECNNNTVKSVKELRSDLNKAFTDWEERRKAVKKSIMLPYEKFETIYKEYISNKYKKADEVLKNRIEQVESELKLKTSKEVEEYFNEYALSKNIDFVTYERLNINVTLSSKINQLKKQVIDFINQICEDISLIETQENKEEILVEYKKTLNCSLAIRTVKERYTEIEKEKQKQNELEEKKKIEAEAIEKIKKVVNIEVLEQPKQEIINQEDENKMFTVKFTVKSTKAKLKELKQFLLDGGYDYE